MTRATVSLCSTALLMLALGGCNTKTPPTPATRAASSDTTASTPPAAPKKPATDEKPQKTSITTTTTISDNSSDSPKEAASGKSPTPDKLAVSDKPTPAVSSVAPAPDKTPSDLKKPAKTGDASAPNSQPNETDRSTVAKSEKSEVDPMDWPNWQGPEQNRISRETGLIDHWHWEADKSDKNENVLWSHEDIAGRCTPIVMRGKLYTICRYLPGQKHEQEQTVCLDAATGEVVWRTLHNMFLSDVPAERMGWASPVGDPTTGRVYAYGSNGLLQCLDGETGKTIWSRSMLEEFGFLSVFGGRTNFPVIFEDLLIVSSVNTDWGERASPAHRFLALDKNTGEIRWYNPGTTERPEDTTFSTPYRGVVNGQMQLIEGSSDGSVWGFQPRTGRPLWSYKMSRRGLSCSPSLSGDTIYMAQNEENLDNFSTGMVAAFSVKTDGAFKDQPIVLGKKNDIWKLPGKMINKSTQCSPLLFEDRLYAPDNASNFYVIDAKKGKLLQKVKLTGDETVGSPLMADGKIYLCTTTGWHVLRPTAKGVEVVDQFRLEGVGEALGSPIVSHGRIYLPTTERLFCLGKKDSVPAAKPLPATAIDEKGADLALEGDKQPAQVQIVPADVLLKPGEKQQYHLNFFDEHGRPAKSDAEATFELKGPGQIDKSGLYTAAEGDAHTATAVTVKVGDLVGHTRLRVVPALPWKFDFQKTALTPNPRTKIPEGVPSQTWIGLNYRHVIRDVEGRKVMVKINTIPKGTRSQGWMGPDDLHDYTIQADAEATTSRPDDPASGLADIGLIAQRYTLVLMGADQQLQIRYWPPQIHTQFSKTVPYSWKDKVWYTIKFQASNEDGKAMLKGKVWPRDEKEPEAWSIEATDDLPNLQGSPGLFGDTSNKGEFYFDNIQVFANHK